MYSRDILRFQRGLVYAGFALDRDGGLARYEFEIHQEAAHDTEANATRRRGTGAREPQHLGTVGARGVEAARASPSSAHR